MFGEGQKMFLIIVVCTRMMMISLKKMHVCLYGTCVLGNYIYLCHCMSPHCQFVTVKYGEEIIRVFDGLKNCVP